MIPLGLHRDVDPSHKCRDRSTVGVGAGPAARILRSSPEATDGALCVTRREAWVTGSACRVSGGFLPALFHRFGGFVSTRCALEVYPSSLARFSIEGRKATAVTHTERDQEARTRGNLARQRGARRLSLAMDARRRLSDRLAGKPAGQQIFAIRAGQLRLSRGRRLDSASGGF